MNAIHLLFKKKKEKVLSVFFVAGYPELEDTSGVIQSLIASNVDLIEIGMPYSDPVADGPVIEAAAARALSNGMTIEKLFQQLEAMKADESKQIPLVLMGYYNPVLQFGFESFCRRAASVGISGLIIPDLPPEIYQRTHRDATVKYGLEMIFLITPETPEERIRMIDTMSSGFIYAVSSSSITGRDTDEGEKEVYLKRLSDMKLSNPVLVGFGIKDKKTFDQACRYSNGAISGTAFVSILTKEGALQERCNDFVRSFYNER